MCAKLSAWRTEAIMTRNLTLRVDEAILRRAKIAAVRRDLSLSQWVAQLILKAVGEDPEYERARRRARRLMNKGFHLGGRPFKREELHER
jgi:hypothetical protein